MPGSRHPSVRLTLERARKGRSGLKYWLWTDSSLAALSLLLLRPPPPICLYKKRSFFFWCRERPVCLCSNNKYIYKKNSLYGEYEIRITRSSRWRSRKRPFDHPGNDRKRLCYSSAATAAASAAIDCMSPFGCRIKRGRRRRRRRRRCMHPESQGKAGLNPIVWRIHLTWLDCREGEGAVEGEGNI